jgi:hypothetical protein
MVVKQNLSDAGEAQRERLLAAEPNGKSEEVLAGRVKRSTKETRD